MNPSASSTGPARSLGDLSDISGRRSAKSIVDKSAARLATQTATYGNGCADSLTWAGGRAGLGKRRSLQGRPRFALTIGSSIFYARFSHFGTRRQSKRESCSAVDPGDVTKRLETWARSRVHSKPVWRSQNDELFATTCTRAGT